MTKFVSRWANKEPEPTKNFKPTKHSKTPMSNTARSTETTGSDILPEKSTQGPVLGAGASQWATALREIKPSPPTTTTTTSNPDQSKSVATTRPKDVKVSRDGPKGRKPVKTFNDRTPRKVDGQQQLHQHPKQPEQSSPPDMPDVVKDSVSWSHKLQKEPARPSHRAPSPEHRRPLHRADHVAGSNKSPREVAPRKPNTRAEGLLAAPQPPSNLSSSPSSPSTLYNKPNTHHQHQNKPRDGEPDRNTLLDPHARRQGVNLNSTAHFPADSSTNSTAAPIRHKESLRPNRRANALLYLPPQKAEAIRPPRHGTSAARLANTHTSERKQQKDVERQKREETEAEAKRLQEVQEEFLRLLDELDSKKVDWANT